MSWIQPGLFLSPLCLSLFLSFILYSLYLEKFKKFPTDGDTVYSVTIPLARFCYVFYFKFRKIPQMETEFIQLKSQ